MAKKIKSRKKKQNLRQVRFNVLTDTGEQVAQRHRWTFFILNNSLETARIRERIYRVLGNSEDFIYVDDYQKLAEGKILEDFGMRYLAFSVSSNKGDLSSDEKRKIYDGKLRRDRDLRSDRENPELWFEESYVRGILRGIR